MSGVHAVISTLALVSPIVVALPVESIFPTYYVVRHSIDGVCEVTTAKPRGPGFTIMGDLHFARKEDADRVAREYCKAVRRV